ncbi:hypothetical protein [Phenylobacterium deserti]|uniref:Uncharacterized protein n=1 Tax=Phenylobacterium deserti TaxID=1914756 RepID=A0A328AUA4_9CAUL|nr:hypothetical protein [Phenylobacterium deserti]RAK57114.1 hypothetical protein DJ018_03925 [Phenylobacterium deserti]
MAEDPRTYQPSTTEVNRARVQGNGVGQQDMDMQQDPDRDTYATEPQNTAGWDNDPPNQGTDRPSQADFSGQDVGDDDAPGEPRSFAADDDTGDNVAPVRDEADVNDTPILGSGTPANVDIHKIGQQDNPEGDWGDAEPGAVFSQNNTRRPITTEGQRGQGAKTRQANKDIVSRRS